MRIGIDNISPGQSTGKQAPGGMRIYLQSLLAWCTQLAPQHEYVLFTPTWADPLLDECPPNLQMVKLAGAPKNRSLRILYQQTVLPLALARHHLDVFFATATVAPLLCLSPVVLAVQFIQFYQSPEAYGRFRTAYLKAILPLSLRKARQVIIFTEYAKRDLINWTDVSEKKVNVVPHGLAEDIWRMAELPVSARESDTRTMYTNGCPYILYVSATYGYKNHNRLIRAFGLLKQRLNTPHVLLLVGAQEKISFAELKQVAEAAGVADTVVFAGQITPYKRVAAVYLGADIAVIPTLYETFGYPVLEAMACGCAVVTSNCGSMAELAGDAALLIDPYDESSIADGMARVLSDPVLRQSLIARGRERAKNYTWDRSSSMTLRILEEATQG